MQSNHERTEINSDGMSTPAESCKATVETRTARNPSRGVDGVTSMTASVTRLTSSDSTVPYFILTKLSFLPLCEKFLAQASLAQLVERALRKRKVTCSNHVWGRIAGGAHVPPQASNLPKI